ncbi:MAG: hypothetical protein AAF125_16870 [Chloroflexota bacterium]
MSHIQITSDQIRQIDDEGLTYIAETGEEQRIDFQVCYENYLAPKLTNEAYEGFKKINASRKDTYDDYVERVRGWREIARRNIFGDGISRDGVAFDGGLPWILFHTIPPKLFTFTDKESFRDVLARISQAGWHTWDSG